MARLKETIEKRISRIKKILEPSEKEMSTTEIAARAGLDYYATLIILEDLEKKGEAKHQSSGRSVMWIMSKKEEKEENGYN